MKKSVKYFLGISISVSVAVLGSDLLGFSNIILSKECKSDKDLAKDSTNVAVDTAAINQVLSDSDSVVKSDSLKK